LSFDDLHKSHGALRDLTESLMQKNLRLSKFFMRSEVKNSWPKYGNLRNRQNCLIFWAILSIFDTKSVFLTFYILGKSLGPLRDLTESPMQKNLRLLEIFHEIISEKFVAKIQKPHKNRRFDSYSMQFCHF